MKYIEIILVFIAVAASAAFVVRKIIQTFSGQGKNACAGCSSRCEGCSVVKINEALRRK